MVPLNPIGLDFAHDQFLGRDHRRVGLPMVGAIERDSPLVQAINELFSDCLITTPALPVQKQACSTITSLPDPELLAFFFEKVPHLIEFQDHGCPRRFRLGPVRGRIPANPLEHGAGADAEHLAQGVHRQPVAIEKDRERFLPQGSAPRGEPRKLVSTGAVAPPLCVPDLAGFHHVLMRTFRRDSHAPLPIMLGIKRSGSMSQKGYLGNTLRYFYELRMPPNNGSIEPYELTPALHIVIRGVLQELGLTWSPGPGVDYKVVLGNKIVLLETKVRSMREKNNGYYKDAIE
jgi:hypothetical protein